MNPWWLVLIVPASAMLGLLLSCLLVMSADNRTIERQRRLLDAYRRKYDEGKVGERWELQQRVQELETENETLRMAAVRASPSYQAMQMFQQKRRDAEEMKALRLARRE